MVTLKLSQLKEIVVSSAIQTVCNAEDHNNLTVLIAIAALG